MSWLQCEHTINILPALARNQVVALTCFGYVGKPAGVPNRVQLEFQKVIDAWCCANWRGAKDLTRPHDHIIYYLTFEETLLNTVGKISVSTARGTVSPCCVTC